MKRTLAFILALVLAVSVLSSCSININIGVTEAPTEFDFGEIEIPSIEIPTDPEPPTEFEVGDVDDYVGVYKEKTLTFGDGNKNVLRIPEIKLDSADAKAANAEIVEKYGDVFASDRSNGIISLDYDAYLNGTILSVVVTSKVDGGNTYGVAYNFEVVSGDGLDNKAVCDAAGKDYQEALEELSDEMRDAYDDRFGQLTKNESMRDKTFAQDNLEASVFYLDGSNDVIALVVFYAAVGGGYFMTQIEL